MQICHSLCQSRFMRVKLMDLVSSCYHFVILINFISFYFIFAFLLNSCPSFSFLYSMWPFKTILVLRMRINYKLTKKYNLLYEQESKICYGNIALIIKVLFFKNIIGIIILLFFRFDSLHGWIITWLSFASRIWIRGKQLASELRGFTLSNYIL